MRTSPCPFCRLAEISRGDQCPECFETYCRVCAGRADRCIELSADEPEVHYCHACCPPLCAECGEVAVAREGLRCMHCHEAEQPVVVRVARMLAPGLAHVMAWRRTHYEPPVPRHAFELDTVPAPDGDAEMAVAVAPTSIRTVYLIRSGRVGGDVGGVVSEVRCFACGKFHHGVSCDGRPSVVVHARAMVYVGNSGGIGTGHGYRGTRVYEERRLPNGQIELVCGKGLDDEYAIGRHFAECVRRLRTAGFKHVASEAA